MRRTRRRTMSRRRIRSRRRSRRRRRSRSRIRTKIVRIRNTASWIRIRVCSCGSGSRRPPIMRIPADPDPKN